MKIALVNMAASSFIICLLVLIAGVSSKLIIATKSAEQLWNAALQTQDTTQGRITEVLSSDSKRRQDIAQNFNLQAKATILEPNNDAKTEIIEAWIHRNPIVLDLFNKVRRQKRDTALEIAPQSSFLDPIGDLIGAIVEPVGNAVGTVVGGAVDVVGGAVDVVGGAVNVVGGAINVVGGAVNEVANSVVSSIGNIVDTILQPITSSVGSLISAVHSVISSIFAPLSSTLGFILVALNQAIKSALRPVLNEIQYGLGQVILSPLVKLLNQLIDIIPCDSPCTSL